MDPVSIAAIIRDKHNRVELWESLLGHLHVQIMAEIGVWKGEFAERLLRDCPAIKHYIMIDPWANLPDWNKPFNVDERQFQRIYAEAMARTDFAADKRRVLRGRTKEVIDDIPDESLDLAYIDGDHTLRGITIDLLRLLPKIRPGGFMAGDDFVAAPWQHAPQFEPTLVCPFAVYCCEALDLPIIALPFNQFLIWKRQEAGFRFTDLVGAYGDLSLNKLQAGVRRQP
jgi:hypothetical protein